MSLWRYKKTRGTEIEWAHQLLVYADDVNLLCKNTNTVKPESFWVVSERSGLEAYDDEAKCTFVTHKRIWAVTTSTELT
jgi:hypothetical protein